MPRDPIGGVIQNLLLLQRLGNTVNADIQPIIADLFEELARAIAALDPTGPPQETYRRRRMKKLIGEIETLAGRSVEQVRKTLRLRMVDVGLLQAAWSESHLRDRVLGGVAVDVASGRVGVNMLKAIIDSRPFEGFLLSEWASAQEASIVRRVHRQVQLGMVLGEPLGDIIRRVRGKAVRGGGFAGGVLEATTRETEALTRTAVNFIANQAHLTTYTQNADILKALEVTATLDGRTTPICIALDRRRTDPANPDPGLVPPFHFRCRTVLTPVVDWEGLGIEAPPEGERASADGPVSGDWTYEDWFRTQSEAEQNEILGPGRADLFRRGKLDLRRLITDDKEVVPLDELRKRAS